MEPRTARFVLKGQRTPHTGAAEVPEGPEAQMKHGKTESLHQLEAVTLDECLLSPPTSQGHDLCRPHTLGGAG